LFFFYPNKRTTIIASQLRVVQWHEIIDENTIAKAISDRILHNIHRINLSGESMRNRTILKYHHLEKQTKKITL
jgi:DNA replication protein DnaC